MRCRWDVRILLEAVASAAALGHQVQRNGTPKTRKDYIVGFDSGEGTPGTQVALLLRADDAVHAGVWHPLEVKPSDGLRVAL